MENVTSLEAINNYNKRIEGIITQLYNCKIDTTTIDLMNIKQRVQKLSALLDTNYIEKLNGKLNAFKEVFASEFR